MKTWQLLHSNPSLWSRYFLRERIVRTIRSFFDKQAFHEVDTPMVIPHPLAESYLEVFETTFLDRERRPSRAFLSTSPEMAMKKLMVAGLGDCYALTKSFRNTETGSTLHNPEFTILEWYRVDSDYQVIMEDCESLFLSIHRALGGEGKLTYQGVSVDLSPPWERLSIADSFQIFTGVTFDDFLDEKKARTIAIAKGYTVSSDTRWEELFHQILLNEIEPKLGMNKPTILYDYPASLAALARKKLDDPRYAERFELYIAGIELGDCYSELTDWKEQEERFTKQVEEIKRLGKTVYDYDQDFIEALKTGLPASSGIALGVDRIVMLFADVSSIQEVMLFPAREMFDIRDM